MTAPHRITVTVSSFTVLMAALAGCEGMDRKHDPAVADVQPPRMEQLAYERDAPEKFNYPDMVEDMMSRRSAYLESIMALERAYLNGGDSARANWARRQRSLVEKLEIYPYLTDKPAEHSVEASPEQTIAEADALYNRAMGILDTFRKVPAAGILDFNKKKARESLDLLKQLLARYPKSDKVDEAAFWCGEIYKEYLREDDPDDELSVRYYAWAAKLNPELNLPARFQCAVVYDFRKHDRARAIELYHQVMDRETFNSSNVRFSATRIEQLTDEEHSHVRPHDEDRRDTAEPATATESEDSNPASRREPVSEHAAPALSSREPAAAHNAETPGDQAP